MGWVISAIALMGSLLAWFVKVTIQAQLSDFTDRIRKEFGDKFMDNNLAATKLETMNRDLGYLRGRIDEVERYAHENNHDIRTMLQRVMLKVGVSE